MRTLRRRPDLLVRTHLAPFLLNPDMPRLGMARPDYVVRKFGGEDRARRLYASIAEIGRAEGVPFRFERIRRTPSSSMRIAWCATRAVSAAPTRLVEALFSAHFTDGHDIGDHAVLSAVAAGVRAGPGRGAPLPAGDDEADRVHADNLRAHRLGINGVPCFVVSGRHAIAGAQEPEVIERLLDVAAVEATEL